MAGTRVTEPAARAKLVMAERRLEEWCVFANAILHGAAVMRRFSARKRVVAEHGFKAAMSLRRPAAALAALLVAVPALAADPVGSVSDLKGRATGTIDGARQALVLDAGIVIAEELATAEESRLRVTFVDSSNLSLGERASVTIDRFVFDDGATRTLTFAAEGALRFVSGRLKRADAQISIATPVAVIGLRGTDVWFGPIDGQFGVLLLEGAVSVSNAAGSVTLDEPGEGTNIAGPNSAPGPVTQWPQQKVDRALAATAF